MSNTPPEAQLALVTGASRGIGAAIAAELAQRGFRVIGTATTDAGAAAIQKQPRGDLDLGHVLQRRDLDAEGIRLGHLLGQGAIQVDPDRPGQGRAGHERGQAVPVLGIGAQHEASGVVGPLGGGAGPIRQAAILAGRKVDQGEAGPG